MVRRRYIDQQVSRLAVWARRLALFSLAATLLTGVIVHLDLLEVRPALATLGAALSFAVLGMVLAFGAFIVIWFEGASGIGHAVTALLVGILLLGYPGYLGIKAYSLPPISDITTDPIDPPRFDTVARLRPRDANPVLYAGLYAAEQQRNAYPDVQPLTVQTTPDVAFETVLKLAARHKWRVVDARPPRPGRDGTAEAIARTLFMGFRDDLAIRVRADADGARIDMRSSSRYGRYDFGVNAKRISSFLEEVDNAIEALQPERRQRDERKDKGKTPPKAKPDHKPQTSKR